MNIDIKTLAGENYFNPYQNSKTSRMNWTNEITNLKMILQIHDELIFEVLDKDSQKISKFIKKIMSDISSNEFYNFSVPLTVDINIGKNWEEAH